MFLLVPRKNLNVVEITARDLIFIVANLFTLAVFFGVTKNKVESLEQRVKKMDEAGTAYARENTARMDQACIYHERRLLNLESQNNRWQELFSNLTTKVEVIVEWVKTQKEKNNE